MAQKNIGPRAGFIRQGFAWSAMTSLTLCLGLNEIKHLDRGPHA
jgi:hypothetical protein